MKWSIKYIVSALPFLFTACSGDWLDLDPSTSVTSDNAIQSLEDAKTALNGIYRIASEHSYYGDNYLYYADCRGEDVQARTPDRHRWNKSPHTVPLEPSQSLWNRSSQ